MTNFTLTVPNDVTGVLNKYLRAPEAAARAVAKTALDVRDILAEATPVDTGDTARRWQVTKMPTRGNPHAVVSNDSVIMVYLEYGTPPHKIYAKNAKALAFTPAIGSVSTQKKDKHGNSFKSSRKLYKSASTGKTVFSAARAETVLIQSVNHPGTRATFTVRSRLPKFAQMLTDNMAEEILRLMRG